MLIHALLLYVTELLQKFVVKYYHQFSEKNLHSYIMKGIHQICGEVKNSLSCNLAFIRPDFDNPSLETDWWRKNVSDHTRLWT